MNILLVGGAVRNLLLGRPVVDKDFLVNGSTREEFCRRFPQAKEVGITFPIFLINGEEYSFLRAKTIDEDLLARDFTINSIAIDENGEIHAHPEALKDLHARVLAPSSENSLKNDPLRVFRGARFLAELDDFSPSNSLLEKMRETAVNGLTASVAAERVGKELLRALKSSTPSNFLKYLNITGNLKPWFNELAEADMIPAGPHQYHDRSVLGHTMEVMDRLAGQGPVRVWMGMVHDLGKCTTPKEILPRHLEHEKRGQALAATLAQRLRLPNRFLKAGTNAARWHMHAARYEQLRAGTKVELLMKLGSVDAIEDLFAVSLADKKTGHNLGVQALADYDRISRIRLPKTYQNLGTKSGMILHQIRAEALSQSP